MLKSSNRRRDDPALAADLESSGKERMMMVSLKQLQRHLSKYGSIVIMLAAFIYISASVPRALFTWFSFGNLLEQMVPLSIVAMGFTVLFSMGEVDLSTSSGIGLVGVSVVSILMIAKMPVWLAIVLSFLIGPAMGAINGFLRINLKMPGLFSTLATQGAFLGVSTLITNGTTVMGKGPNVDAFTSLGGNYIGGLPLTIPMILMVLVVLLTWVLMNRMKFGRLAYMIGANSRTSILSGVNADRRIFGAFIWCGTLTGLAGIAWTSRIGSGSPPMGGDLLLDGIIAVTVGSTVASEQGEVSAFGSIISALFLTMLLTGMQLMDMGYPAQKIFRGVLLIVSLAFFSMKTIR